MRKSHPIITIVRYALLVFAAVIFAFPFYFMVVGAFQSNPTNTPDRLLPLSGWTTGNFININARIDLLGSLCNSLIFVCGVLLGTVVFGLLAGYAVARMDFRGKGVVWILMLLVQMVPFQLLMIPLYVQVTRTYGLGDTYLGMILPFAINTTAVFIFIQFFKSLPADIFEAARVDGAGELRILWTIAIPMVRPALATVVLVTFIGPWNEFLWPFLITKDVSMQPLAVSLANYISTVSQSVANPNGAILSGAATFAFPVIVLFCLFQKYFVASDIGSALKG
ncbi:MAG: carbohydrate ABC transporter permease [Bifidobacterium scardovii]|uniref:Binding-protein-dependent transport system inner membrane protein n=1 Tax=Bifidobacterium scardovii TaxID=158787 RepID=A0A087DIP1_9BIFI|nr:carbohydrate ABC transporter permease [Bifidobacterium scardovii]KFI95391.1 binding-protein-dependent transport system inner membrane protein [Bifidobacterium scardovii]MDK6348964.1 carbohydrate ABC transporter permease [Bifidobacterium scardovii]MDU8980914.1 carbohydrate ABC transporter permease [Bifidobacterium scardovii]BAQ31052.1 putative ABC transporter permease component [Bifidobacterium scardovii JCM 12489 = DSM 13734]